ncbi:staphylopine family metallophore export MFS transporter CntE [Paenibacillus sp. FSL K6-1230]|uniref:staphylopine family metallophore export MFS transporter CntE n=1 Tax=Paenibacillus sp. FSL K6-1230 TaxID=2921603 RepID=UPI0030F80AF2
MKGALSLPFLRLYLLTLLYFSANSILNVIIPLKGDSLGATNTTIGVVMGAYLLTTMVFRPWAGQVIQRYGPIKVLRVILVINGLALLIYTFAGLGGYFFARVLQGVCTAFFSMSLQLGIIEELPEKERSEGISMYSLCASMPGVFGPLLAVGMWRVEDIDYFAMAMISIAVLTGITGFSTKVGPKEAELAKKEQSLGTGMLSSYSQLIKNPHLFRCSVIMFTASLVFGAVTTFIPLYAGQIHNGSAAIFLMLQAGIIVITRFVLRKKIPSDGKWHTSFIMGIMLILAIGVECISLSNVAGALLFYVGAFFLGVAQALIYPTLTTYLSFVLPQVNRNILIGLFIAMADLGVSMGGILLGPIADFFSYSTMYMICSILAALMLVFAFKRLKPSDESVLH